MDYEKLKEYGQNIKLTDEAKAEITEKCKAVQSESNEKGGVMLTVVFRRTAAVFAAAAVIIAGIACVKYLKQPAPSIDNAETSLNVITSAETSTVTTPTQTATKSGNTVTTENDIGGGIIELRKYRVCYYNIPAPFAALVGRDACLEWELEYGKTHNVHLSERMLMVDFINHFDISKEDFEKANLEFAKNFGKEEKKTRNPQDYAHQEIYEVYNPDIIYTFDDEIINEYYLSHDYPFLYEHEYEEALEAGTYQTQTTDWVDIEQMEAEINAKYGAPEVTETTTAIPEETEITE